MNIEFKKTNQDDYKNIYDFMKPIWYNTYSFLNTGQVDYLLDKYFNIDNLKAYVKKGLIYEDIILNNELIGYLGFYIYKDHLFLDKAYLKLDYQNKGLSKQIFSHLKEYNLPIRLCVNQNNKQAISSYFKNGFIVIEEQVNVLEHGYINLDYILEKK